MHTCPKYKTPQNGIHCSAKETKTKTNDPRWSFLLGPYPFFPLLSTIATTTKTTSTTTTTTTTTYTKSFIKLGSIDIGSWPSGTAPATTMGKMFKWITPKKHSLLDGLLLYVAFRRVYMERGLQQVWLLKKDF